MFDFIGKKNYFFVLSGLIILAAIVGLIIHGGFNLDIQFQGGTILEIEMEDNDFSPKEAAEVATRAINKTISAQYSYTLNSENNNDRIDFLILNVSSSQALTDEERTMVIDEIKKEFKVKEGGERTTRHVDPSIGKELMSKSLMAIIIAAFLMLLYIWWRFNIMSGLLAGATAIIALLHDAAIMLSVYAVLNIPLNESFIAAVLTILGYSMNDTIIVFDRIRENSTLLRKETIASLVNKSIMQTLSRSINTSATTIMCILTVFLFASYNRIGTITDFTMPLMVGLISGTYSSIFIASPLWVMFKESQAKKKLAAKPAKA